MWNILKKKVEDNDFSLIFVLWILIGLAILSCAEFKALNTPRNISSYYLTTQKPINSVNKFQYIIKGNIPWRTDIYCYRTFDKKDAFNVLKILNDNYISNFNNQSFKR